MQPLSIQNTDSNDSVVMNEDRTQEDNSHYQLAHMNLLHSQVSSAFQESEKIFDYFSNGVVFFVFSRPFNENFKLLKNCPYDFHKVLYSPFTFKGAPSCAKASKLHDWDVRNIAKISPKMAKKQPFDFLKTSPSDSNKIFYSHSTL